MDLVFIRPCLRTLRTINTNFLREEILLKSIIES